MTRIRSLKVNVFLETNKYDDEAQAEPHEDELIDEFAERVKRLIVKMCDVND